jgi:hypothetical protein
MQHYIFVSKNRKTVWGQIIWHGFLCISVNNYECNLEFYEKEL